MKRNRLPSVTRVFLMILMLGVLATLFLVYVIPSVGDLLSDNFGFPMHETFFYAFVSVSAVLALWVLSELYFVMLTVEKDPFILRNVQAFLRMGIAAELAGVLFFVKCFFYFTPMTLVVSVVMVLSGMFALVMHDVFDRAVRYKLENDLTI